MAAFRAGASADPTPSPQCLRVRLADVASHVNGAAPGPDWHVAGLELAAGRGDVVLDWAGCPTIPWHAAAQLVAELRETQQRAQRAHAERERAADGEMAMVGGIVGISRPGRPDELAPWMERHDDNGAISRP